MGKSVNITDYKASVKISTKEAVRSVQNLQKALRGLDKQLSSTLSSSNKSFKGLQQLAKTQVKSAEAVQSATKKTNRIKKTGSDAEKRSMKRLVASTKVWIAGNQQFHKFRARSNKEAASVERRMLKAATKGDKVRLASLKKEVALTNQRLALEDKISKQKQQTAIRERQAAERLARQRDRLNERLANKEARRSKRASRGGTGIGTGVSAGITSRSILGGLAVLGTGKLMQGIFSTANEYQRSEVGLEAAMYGSGTFERKEFKDDPSLIKKALDNQRSFAYTMASNYGMDQANTTMDLGKFMVSALSTENESKMEIGQIQELFQGLSKQGVIYGLGEDQFKRAMNAFTQMANKGQVKAEELKNQLGDVLPGAMKLFADAIGVTQGELLAMMDRGELMAWDVLPKVAKELNRVSDAGGAFEKALATPAKQVDILVSGLKDLAIGMGKQFEKPLSDLLLTVNGFVREFRVPLAEIGGSFIEAFVQDIHKAIRWLITSVTPYLRQWEAMTSAEKGEAVREWATSIQNAVLAFAGLSLSGGLLDNLGKMMGMFAGGKVPSAIDKIGVALKKLIPIVAALALPFAAFAAPFLAVAAAGMGGFALGDYLYNELSKANKEVPKGANVADQLATERGLNKSVANSSFLNGTIKTPTMSPTGAGSILDNAKRVNAQAAARAKANSIYNTFEISIEQHNQGRPEGVPELRQQGKYLGSVIGDTAAATVNDLLINDVTGG